MNPHLEFIGLPESHPLYGPCQEYLIFRRTVDFVDGSVKQEYTDQFELDGSASSLDGSNVLLWLS